MVVDENYIEEISLDFVSCSFHRMHGSAQSAGSIIYLSRGTVFAAGLCGKTGSKMSLDLLIPSLSPTSQHVALLPTTMKTMTVTQASMSQTAAEQYQIPSSCLPTPQLTAHCPLRSRVKGRDRCLSASTRMSSSQRERVRKVWAWKLKTFGLRRCWSRVSSVECDHVMET